MGNRVTTADQEDQRNARFWVYINGGPVRLTLKPGQSLEWDRWSRTDEGWSYEYECWLFSGDKVYRVSDDDGEDCDGRLSHSYKTVVDLKDLASGSPDGTVAGVFYPLWSRVKASQRDYSAEAMGY